MSNSCGLGLLACPFSDAQAQASSPYLKIARVRGGARWAQFETAVASAYLRYDIKQATVIKHAQMRPYLRVVARTGPVL